MKKEHEDAGERVGESGRPTEARGVPIANGTDGTNARVASLFPPANRVKSPRPLRSSRDLPGTTARTGRSAPTSVPS